MFYPSSYGRFCLNIVNKSNFESFYIQTDDYVDYDYCSKPRQSDSFQSSEALKFKTKIKRKKFRFILSPHKAVDYCSSVPCGDNHVLLCHRRYLQCLLSINNADWMNSHRYISRISSFYCRPVFPFLEISRWPFFLKKMTYVLCI